MGGQICHRGLELAVWGPPKEGGSRDHRGSAYPRLCLPQL